MKIQVITPTNGTPAYIQLQVGEHGIIEKHQHKLICYVHDSEHNRDIPAYPDGWDINSKLRTLEDFIELRDAMHNQFGC